MSSHHRQSGLSITELMAVTLIVLVIVSLLFPIANLIRDKSRLTDCMGNLTQLNLGIHQYFNERGAYPAHHSDLMKSLNSYISETALFKCPEDEEEVDDSYSPYFVSRHREDDEQSLLIACPRHFGYEKSLNMTLAAGTHVADLMLVYKTQLTGDEEITAGESVSGGAGIKFEEAVTVSPTLDQPVMRAVTGYSSPNGTQYALIDLPETSSGRIEVKATADATVEVSTHAGLIHLKGAEVVITVQTPAITGGPYRASVEVQAGKATLTPTPSCYIEILPGNFNVSKDQDSAYRPTEIPAGKTARSGRD